MTPTNGTKMTMTMIYDNGTVNGNRLTAQIFFQIDIFWDMERIIHCESRTSFHVSKPPAWSKKSL